MRLLRERRPPLDLRRVSRFAHHRPRRQPRVVLGEARDLPIAQAVHCLLHRRRAPQLLAKEDELRLEEELGLASDRGSPARLRVPVGAVARGAQREPLLGGRAANKKGGEHRPPPRAGPRGHFLT